MLIGIDAHNLEGNRTGVGRYLFNLLKVWAADDRGRAAGVKFILYFKDEIPVDLPLRPASSELQRGEQSSGQATIFETRLLKTRSTAKFIHWDLCRAAKKDMVDILFCPGYVAPIFFRGKIALTLHDIIYEAHQEWFEWKSWADRILLKLISKISAKRADIIFTISEFSRGQIIKYYRVAPEKIVLTRLAADPSLSPGSPQTELDSIKKYKIKDKFVFFVASIFERRHLPEVIDAFKKLNRPDHQLLIGGRDHTDGKKVDIMSAATNQQLGRDAIIRVDFIGDYDLKSLYSACAFFIWLSDYEGFGLPPLEAMACGAPLITSQGSSLDEVVGSAALTIKNNLDVEEIYQAMKRILADEDLRQDLIKKGKEQAAKFSWEKCAQETLDKLMLIVKF